MDAANVTISVYYFILILPVIGMSYYWGYRDGRKKMKIDRDLCLKGMIKAQTERDEYKTKYHIVKQLKKKA